MTKTRKAAARAAAVRRLPSTARQSCPLGESCESGPCCKSRESREFRECGELRPTCAFKDTTLHNAELTWQELQGIADRVRILKRVVMRLSASIQTMQERARARRQGAALLVEK